MYGSNRVIIICVISSICWMNHAFEGESILGGTEQQPFVSTYQVAVLGKKNFTTGYNVLCGGGIIDNKLIITAAQCFMETYGQLREFTYYVIVDTYDLSRTDINSVFEVDKIYMQDYTDIYSFNDLAIVKIKGRFHYTTQPRLSKLKIPHIQSKFIGRYGKVVGYECSGYHNPPSDNSTLQYVIKEVNVKVVADVPTRALYSTFNTDLQLYGLIVTDEPNQQWGLCYHDAGSPLVIDEQVVGVVSKVSYTNNDALYGVVFTNAVPFHFWIELLKYDLVFNLSAFIFNNRPHTL